MAVLAEDAPEVTGEVRVWQSSRIGKRASCASCGGALWHESTLTGRKALALGCFDVQDGWTMARQICADERPQHYGFGVPAPAFTGWGTLWAVLTGRLPR